jgi:hypothetical protein
LLYVIKIWKYDTDILTWLIFLFKILLDSQNPFWAYIHLSMDEIISF